VNKGVWHILDPSGNPPFYFHDTRQRTYQVRLQVGSHRAVTVKTFRFLQDTVMACLVASTSPPNESGSVPFLCFCWFPSQLHCFFSPGFLGCAGRGRALFSACLALLSSFTPLRDFGLFSRAL